jgi:ABC-type multidrug transport system permease subunit
MSRILRLAANDLLLTRRDRAAFFWLLLTPLAMMWFFGRVTFGGGDAPRIALTILDRDGGAVAQSLAAEMAGDRVRLTVLHGAEAGVDPPPGTARWVVLPAGLTGDVLAGRPRRLRVESTEDAPAEDTRAAEVLVLRAIVRTLAVTAELRQTGAAVTAEAAASLRARPRLVSLEVSSAGKGSVVPRGAAQSVPGILTFTVMMMTLIYGAVFLTIEKREGMLRRQLTLPVGRGSLFAGKVLGRLFLASFQIAILLLAGRFLFSLPLGHSMVGLLGLSTSYAFAVAGLATFLGALVKNPEQASAVGWLSSMVMAAMGGCWWPSEVMPEWLRVAAHVFPTAWAMDGFHALISFGRPASAVLAPCAALWLFGTAFALWGSRRLAASIGD